MAEGRRPFTSGAVGRPSCVAGANRAALAGRIARPQHARSQTQSRANSAGLDKPLKLKLVPAWILGKKAVHADVLVHFGLSEIAHAGGC